MAIQNLADIARTRLASDLWFAPFCAAAITVGPCMKVPLLEPPTGLSQFAAQAAVLHTTASELSARVGSTQVGRLSATMSTAHSQGLACSAPRGVRCASSGGTGAPSPSHRRWS